MEARSAKSIVSRSIPIPFARGGRQTILERADVVLVERLRLVVPSRPGLELLLEPPPLLLRIVQLRVGVRHLHAGDEQLEAVDEAGIVPLLASQRRQLGREVDDEGRLDERRLDERLEHVFPHLVRGRLRAPAPGARVETEPAGRLPSRRPEALPVADVRAPESDGLGHRVEVPEAAPGRREVDPLPLVGRAGARRRASGRARQRATR